MGLNRKQWKAKDAFRTGEDLAEYVAEFLAACLIVAEPAFLIRVPGAARAR